MCPLKNEAQRGACLFFIPSSAYSSAAPHAAGSGRQLSSSVWLLAVTGCHQPSAFLLHQMCRPGKQKSDQLTGLRFQPAISASSTARQDFAKIHIRQLLRTLLFCLYHPEHAVCLSVCLQDPAFEPVPLLFPWMARVWSRRNSQMLLCTSQRTQCHGEWRHHGWDAAHAHLSRNLPPVPASTDPSLMCPGGQGSPARLIKSPPTPLTARRAILCSGSSAWPAA